MGRKFADSSRDALRAVRTLSFDPVGGLPSAYADLGGQRAAGAGFVLCAVFTLAAALGFHLSVRNWLGFWGNVFGLGGAGTFVKALLMLLVPPAALAGMVLGVRRVAGAREVGGGAAVFIAGAALAPLGLASFIGSLFGPGGFRIASVLYLAAFCYLVLILYAGLTGLVGVRPRVAAPCVSGMILISLWLTSGFLIGLF